MHPGLLLWLVGCGPAADGETGSDTGPLPAPDCFAEGNPRLEVSLESGSYDDVFSGMTVPVAIPPQGGAPYTPWQVRVTGDGALNGGVRMVATATDGAVEIGDVEFDLIPICANVPPNDGWWILTGVHLRYWDYAVEDLLGREVNVHFSLQDVGGGAERAGLDLAVVLGSQATRG